jgi:hypothetical protein
MQALAASFWRDSNGGVDVIPSVTDLLLPLIENYIRQHEWHPHFGSSHAWYSFGLSREPHVFEDTIHSKFRRPSSIAWRWRTSAPRCCDRSFKRAAKGSLERWQRRAVSPIQDMSLASSGVVHSVGPAVRANAGPKSFTCHSHCRVRNKAARQPMLQIVTLSSHCNLLLTVSSLIVWWA